MRIAGKQVIDIFNSDESQCMAEIRAFIESGGNKNLVDEKSGWSLLHYCCECQQVEVLKYLISVGLDVEVEDKQGWRPIHLAVDSDIDSAIQSGEDITFSCTKVLVKGGANLSSRYPGGIAPRDMASEYGEEILAAFDEAMKKGNV
jgi:ankyrin repeat protein